MLLLPPVQCSGEDIDLNHVIGISLGPTVKLTATRVVTCVTLVHLVSELTFTVILLICHDISGLDLDAEHFTPGFRQGLYTSTFIDALLPLTFAISS